MVTYSLPTAGTPHADVVVAGELFVDLIMSGLDFWPEPGKEVFAKAFHREIGGGPMITACGLAKLGLSVRLFGVAGDDQGGWIAEKLTHYGVAVPDIQLDATEATAFTVIATGPKDRAFLTYDGPNHKFETAFREAVSATKAFGSRHIHLSYAPSFDAGEALFEEIHRHGCTISLDVGWRENWISDRRALSILRLVDIFFPNESEARRITGEEDPKKMLQAFADTGVARVALKLGSNGAALLWDGAFFSGAACRVTPVDTTGAGDSFDAGFLYAWLQGREPARCLQAGNICGALSTEAYGGIAGFPTTQRLSAELDSQCSGTQAG
jgi:sugar/nucleoside kinase (ribokinase family)